MTNDARYSVGDFVIVGLYVTAYILIHAYLCMRTVSPAITITVRLRNI